MSLLQLAKAVEASSVATSMRESAYWFPGLNMVHLLGLLVTFIGEPLTLALVREAWPDISLDEPHSTTEID